MITAASLSLSLGRLMAPNVSMLVSEQLMSVERKGQQPGRVSGTAGFPVWSSKNPA